MYKLLGVATGVVGVLVALFGPTSAVTHKAVEGITVFAVLYILAQGVERLIEWIMDFAALTPGSPAQKKESGLRSLAVANSTLNGNPSTDDFTAAATEVGEAKKTVEEARTDLTFLAHGLSILLSALAVVALNYSLLSLVGAQGVDKRVDILLSALAVAGGSKGIHELVGRLQKAKESAEESAA